MRLPEREGIGRYSEEWVEKRMSVPTENNVANQSNTRKDLMMQRVPTLGDFPLAKGGVTGYNTFCVPDGEVAVPCTRNPL